MHNLEGIIREKLGRTVFKVMLLRNVGTFIDINEHNDPVEVVKWRVVAQKFFGDWEKWWKFDKTHAYELKLENECYGRGEVHVQFIDYDTGNSINMTGQRFAASDPAQLATAIDCEHIKEWVKRNKTTGAALAICAVCVALGLFVGFTVGQNWGNIIHTFQQGAVNATATPGLPEIPITGALP